MQMLTAAATEPPFQSFLHSLRDLFAAERGHAQYECDDDGNLIHVATVITVQSKRGESIEAFHDRVRAKYRVRKGDKLDVLNNGGRCDTIRLTLLPRE